MLSVAHLLDLEDNLLGWGWTDGLYIGVLHNRKFPLRRHQDLSDDIRTSQTTSGPLRRNQDLSDDIRTSQTTTVPLRRHQDLSDDIGTSQAISGPLRRHQDLSDDIRTSQTTYYSITLAYYVICHRTLHIVILILLPPFSVLSISFFYCNFPLIWSHYHLFVWSFISHYIKRSALLTILFKSF